MTSFKLSICTFCFTIILLIGFNTTVNGMTDPPTNLMATALTSSSIQLDWDDNSADETGFTIEMSTDEMTGFFVKGEVAADVTTFVADDLPNAETTYYFRVTKKGETDYSNTANATTLAPEPPTNLASGTITSITVELNWDDNTNFETGYWIERSDDMGMSFSFVGNTDADVTTFTDQGLTGSTMYQYRVAGRLGPSPMDLTAFSNVLQVTTAPPNLPNGVPGGLTATSLGTSSIRINWTDQSTNETGFKIERSDFIDNFYVEVAEVGEGQTTYTSTDLVANSTYFFRVTAVNAEGESNPSATASAKTDIAAPEAPTNLDTTFVGPSEIIITWRDNASFETGYKVQVASFGDFATVSELGPDTETDTLSNLDEVTLYTIRVLAVNASGETSSNELQVATTQNPPGAPTELSFNLSADGDLVVLSWIDNAENEEGFRIERSVGDTETFEELDDADVDMTTYTDTVEVGQNYFYRVAAFNAGGISDYTNITGTVLASVAENLEKLLTIYPNPSRGLINVSLDEQLDLNEVRIFNYTGQLVRSYAGKEGLEIDLTNNNEGLYFIELEVGDALVRKKILISR